MKKAVFASLALALSLGAFATTSSAAPDCPRDGVCPAIYDPVICNDGQIYSNDCYARLACARGCQPYNG